MKKALIKTIILAVFFGMFFALRFLNTEGDLYASDIILKYAFSNHSFLYTDIIYICIEMIPYFTFMFIFGTYIYEHFNIASVYYFSRCSRRVRWLCKEMFKLFIITLIFVTLMPIAGIGLAAAGNHILFDVESLWIYFYFIIIYSFWLFGFTLIINIISIRKGSLTGFSIVTGVLLVFIALFALWNNESVFSLNLIENPDLMRNTKFLMLNFAAHLILPWHSSTNIMINNRINYLGLDFDLNISVVLFIVIAMISVLISIVFVKKQDLIILTRQMEN